jgi:hypothetical protein
MSGRSLQCALPLLAALAACGGGSGDDTDASCLCDAPNFDADPLLPDAEPPADASPADLFNHFTIDVVPGTPTQGLDFDVEVHAYASGDNSTTLEYDGTLTVSASCGALTGDTSGAITAGLATLTVQTVSTGVDCVITVTDADYPSMTGDTMVDIVLQGASAGVRDVVISEVNWFGNAGSFLDEWIELRNTTGAAINVSTWVIDNAGVASIQLPLGTTIAAGGYLVVAKMQGPDTDGNRTSLTGVTPVVLAAVDLVNGGEQLTLRDVDGDPVDQTPTAPWPAGDNTLDRTMERRDDLSGGGYTDGTSASAWYTWYYIDGTDSTSADSSDQGTPGQANTNPEFLPPILYTTSYEAAQPTWIRIAGTDTFGSGVAPPTGTTARTGTLIMTNSTVTTSYSGRIFESSDCIALTDADPLVFRAWGIASTANGGNEIRGRQRVLWFTDAGCTTAHATDFTGPISGPIFPEGSHARLEMVAAPPDATATHVKLRIEVKDDNGGTNAGDDWAIDDIALGQ